MPAWFVVPVGAAVARLAGATDMATVTGVPSAADPNDGPGRGPGVSARVWARLVAWARAVGPGLAVTVVLTALAFVLARSTGPLGIGATALGVGLGVAVGNTWRPGTAFDPGIRFAGKRLLTVAVILLGLQITVGDVVGIGVRTAVVVLGVVAGAILLALGLGRLLGVPNALAACIGVGTGICGVSAIAAVQRAVGASDEDLTYAVASITLLGSVGLITYPLLQLGVPLLATATDYGILAGATLHSVPQAVGAGFAGGGDAGGLAATLAKLSRVALLGPVALTLALAFHGRGRELGDKARRLPLEVTGFLALFALGSLIELPSAVLTPVAQVDRWLLVTALTALGLHTRFGELKRAGATPLWLAFAVWGTLFAVVLMGLTLAA